MIILMYLRLKIIQALPEEYTNCLYAEPEFVEMCTLYGLKETDKME